MFRQRQIQTHRQRNEGASAEAIEKALNKAKKRYEAYPNMKQSVENWLSSIGQRCVADSTLMGAAKWVTSKTQYDCIRMFEPHPTAASSILNWFETIAMYTHSERAMTEVARCVVLLHTMPEIAAHVANDFAMLAMTSRDEKEVMRAAKECLKCHAGIGGERWKKWMEDHTNGGAQAGENAETKGKADETPNETEGQGADEGTKTE